LFIQWATDIGFTVLIFPENRIWSSLPKGKQYSSTDVSGMDIMGAARLDSPNPV
jgi:hypothetical protein